MYSAFVVGFGVLLLVCQDIQAQDVLCNKGENYVDVVLNSGDEFTYDTKNNRKNKYKKNQFCLASYELGESCSGASISCPTFALRGNRRCTSGDIMEIFGDSTDQSFCRDSGPMDYQPDGDFFILFTSNQRGSAEGFKCTVKCIDGGSGPTTQSTAAPTGNTGSTPTASTTASTATSPTTPTTVTTPTTPTTVTTPTTTTTGSSGRKEFYVSNEGNDNWDGSSPVHDQDNSGPWKSIVNAIQKIRNLRGISAIEPDEIAVLNLIGGVYQIESTINLNQLDSNLELRSYKEEDVLLSGGITKPVQGLMKGEIKTAEVSGKCGDIFLNNVRLVKARSPNVEVWKENTPIAEGPYHTVTDLLESTDSCNMESTSFVQTCPQANREGFVSGNEFGQEWESLNKTEVIIFHSWISEYAKVASVTNVNGRNEVKFQEPLQHNSVGAYPSYGGFRFLILNNKALLDHPGEYYCDQIDESTAEVSFIPLETAENGALTISQTSVILQINRATDVKVHGLRFQHTTGKGVKDGYQWGADSALRILNTNNIEIDNCEFANLGVIGLYTSTVESLTVQRSLFYDIGSHGIMVFYQKQDQPSRDILLRNNKLAGCGNTNFWQPACIWAGAESNLTITNNDISGAPTPLRVKGVMPHGKSYWTDRNIVNPTRSDYIHHIEYNHIHDFGVGITNDFGGVYLGPTYKCDDATLAELEQNCYSYIHVFNNMIHDANSYKGSNSLMYSDVSLSRVTFENNILYGNVDVAMKHHCGLDNWSINNYLHSTTQTFYPDRKHYLLGGCGSDTRFSSYENHHNIYFMENITNLSVFRPIKKQVEDLHDNLYWSPITSAKEAELFWDSVAWWKNGLSWEEWIGQGYDVDSQWIDPMFENAESFQLSSDSPALAMGIKQIEVHNIGIQEGIKYWKNGDANKV